MKIALVGLLLAAHPLDAAQDRLLGVGGGFVLILSPTGGTARCKQMLVPMPSA